MNCLGLLSSHNNNNTDSLARSASVSNSTSSSKSNKKHSSYSEDKRTYDSPNSFHHIPDSAAVATVGVQPMRRIVCEEEENPYSSADLLFQDTIPQPNTLHLQQAALPPASLPGSSTTLGKATSKPRKQQYLSLYSTLGPGPAPPQVVEVIVPPSPQFPNSPSVPLSQVDSLFQDDLRYGVEGSYDDDFNNYAADDDTSYEDEPQYSDDLVYSYFSEVSVLISKQIIQLRLSS